MSQKGKAPPSPELVGRFKKYGPSVRAALSTMALSTNVVSPMEPRPEEIIREGWLLKKRRRKMQGFAKRYFRLYSSGLLSYAYHPDLSPRDQIDLSSAVISNKSHRLDIHIDSDNSLFHIHCESSAQFDQWMSDFRRFVHVRDSTLHRSSIRSPIVRTDLKPSALVKEMDSNIHELREQVSIIRSEEAKLKSPSFLKIIREKEQIKDMLSSKEKDSIFSMFRKNSHSDLNSETNTNTTKSTTPSTSDKSHTHSRLDNIGTILQLLSEQCEQLAQMVAELEAPKTKSSFLSHNRSFSASQSISDGSVVWFDAPDSFGEGGEELVLDHEGDTSSLKSDNSIEIDDSSDEAHVEELIQVSQATSVQPSPVAERPTHVFTRRTALPARMLYDEGSLFSMLKKNVGKDLSAISFPVTFNEPLSLLQRLAEDMEYNHLLDEAVANTNPIDRMCLVAAFAVSGYACTKLRSGRKSFTPMMGETFEDVRSNFIAEKVSHNPLIMACHAHGEGWEYWATSSGRTKFWGKSLEIAPSGTTHLKIGKDHYEWQRPSTFVRNLMMGTKYLEHCGQLIITNTTTNARSILEFKETGYWGSSPNVVTGAVLSPSGNVDAKLEGTWHEQLTQVLDDAHFKLLWRAHPFQKDATEYYGFTSYAITLNEVTPDIADKIAPTDSRLRPDIRALEEGKIDWADTEKIRIEEAQRERRRNNGIPDARWFKQVGEDYVYSGGYWEERESGWKSTARLW
ncbi:hypothetical protein SISSUDRAFT_1056912 [Sistotremastrum suecicum HHB10207 ss-3]|uniref:PH domain-containing protein n=1 Tax=Sistotremastrum suecicum HHB10207 ss-3 TaxID=1314776 RepID=A0A166JC01_9AGAM|nr:hypothetical protein SISSUDRAFT_1056912 [Sistotremastrum suecicum HHB10207 ss-3]